MFRLDGKAAAITGGASGIGEQIARRFAEQGAAVLIADRDEAGAIRVAGELQGASALRMDVTQAEDAQHLVAVALERFGRLDVLVNNAGIGFVGSIEETPEEEWNRLWAVNVTGVYQCARFAIPAMLAQGNGNIINLASVAGLIGVERRFAYCATKGAVISMTRQLALEYVRRGIRVNCICPATVHTPFVDSYLDRFHHDNREETLSKLHARQPIGRMGRPEEVASLAVYLAADESAFVTGAAMVIDGGWTAA